MSGRPCGCDPENLPEPYLCEAYPDCYFGREGTRREGRTRLVAGASVVTAQCAIWQTNERAPMTRQVLEVLERAGARNIWLRDDVFDQVAFEQGLNAHAWPRVEFVYRYWQCIRRRSERPPERARPNLYECGCSRHKVDAGLCDLFAPGGMQRGARAL